MIRMMLGKAYSVTHTVQDTLDQADVYCLEYRCPVCGATRQVERLVPRSVIHSYIARRLSFLDSETLMHDWLEEQEKPACVLCSPRCRIGAGYQRRHRLSNQRFLAMRMAHAFR